MNKLIDVFRIRNLSSKGGPPAAKEDKPKRKGDKVGEGFVGARVPGAELLRTRKTKRRRRKFGHQSEPERKGTKLTLSLTKFSLAALSFPSVRFHAPRLKTWLASI